MRPPHDSSYFGPSKRQVPAEGLRLRGRGRARWVGGHSSGSVQALPGLGTLLLPCQLLRGVGSACPSLSTLSRKRAITHGPRAVGRPAKLLKDLLGARPKAAENAAPSLTPARLWSKSLLRSKPQIPSKTSVRWSEAPSPLLSLGPGPVQTAAAQQRGPIVCGVCDAGGRSEEPVWEWRMESRKTS